MSQFECELFGDIDLIPDPDPADLVSCTCFLISENRNDPKDILNGTFERKSIFVCVFKEIVPGFE